MAIKIIREPDVYVTEGEMQRLRQEYDRQYMFYSGVPPTFEEFVRERKQRSIAKEPK